MDYPLPVSTPTPSCSDPAFQMRLHLAAFGDENTIPRGPAWAPPCPRSATRPHRKGPPVPAPEAKSPGITNDVMDNLDLHIGQQASRQVRPVPGVASKTEQMAQSGHRGQQRKSHFNDPAGEHAVRYGAALENPSGPFRNATLQASATACGWPNDGIAPTCRRLTGNVLAAVPCPGQVTTKTAQPAIPDAFTCRAIVATVAATCLCPGLETSTQMSTGLSGGKPLSISSVARRSAWRTDI